MVGLRRYRQCSQIRRNRGGRYVFHTGTRAAQCAVLVCFSKRNSGTFQIGNLVQIAWNARLEEHLGTAKVELLTPYAAAVLADAERLSVLASACALLLLLPEREPNPDFLKNGQAAGGFAIRRLLGSVCPLGGRFAVRFGVRFGFVGLRFDGNDGGFMLRFTQKRTRRLPRSGCALG